jgi:hypothetical protein
VSTKRKSTPSKETPVSTTTESTPTSAGHDWPREPEAILVEYLAERVSADQDAPNRRLPFVTGGVLRVHPSDWLAWLTDHGMPAPRREALAVLKSADLVQKVYALPGEDGKSAGFYTGPVPAGAGKLPERVVQRVQGKPRSPFGRLTDEQRELLVKALGKLTAERDQVLRDQLLAHLEPSAD